MQGDIERNTDGKKAKMFSGYELIEDTPYHALKRTTEYPLGFLRKDTAKYRVNISINETQHGWK